MLENLLQTLPEPRWPALREELELLDLMREKAYLLPRDAAVARIPDLQGMAAAARGLDELERACRRRLNRPSARNGADAWFPVTCVDSSDQV
jgi:hypothetical protein